MKQTFRKIWLAFRKHILTDIKKGNISKPLHFLLAVFKRKFLGYPYVALIETGNFCNICCPTCTTPHRKIKREKALMSFENFKKVIDNIKDSVHIAHLYYSGEPLLHPDICRMANYAHKNHLYTSISTNATLLDKEKAKEIFQSGLDEIIVCLDGVKKESYEAFRVGANFETVMENIKYFCSQKQALRRQKPFIEMQFVLHRFNQNEVPAVQKLAQELKVDRLHIKTFALGEYAYSPGEIAELSAKYFPDSGDALAKRRYEKQGDKLVVKEPPQFCSMVKSLAFILVDGRLSMCCYDLQGEYIWGNMLNQKLKSVWFNKELAEKRKIAIERRYPLCKKCSIY